MDNDKVEEILEKQEEMLILVRKLWRAEKWRRFWTIFRYAVYIGILFGVFYFLTPYIERTMSLFQQFKSVSGSSVDFQKLLEQLPSLSK